MASLREMLAGEFRPALLILLGTAGCLLLLACASLANLLVARSAAQEREMAVRVPLGASRRDRALRVLLINLILTAFGAIPGLALCRAAVAGIAWLEPELSSCRGVCGARAGHGIFRFRPGDPRLKLQDHSHCAERRWARRNYRRAPAADSRIAGSGGDCACAESAGISGLLAKSFIGLMGADLGFTPENVLLLESNLGDSYYNTSARRVGYYRPLFRALSGLPGVVSVGGLRYFPMHARLWSTTMRIKENPVSSKQQPVVYWNRVAGDYFNAMRIPLIAGRLPTVNEMWGGSDSVLINSSAARASFQNGNAVGKHIQLGDHAQEVIGVVGSVRQSGPGRPPGPEVYSLRAADESTGILTIAIRTREKPDRGIIRSIVAARPAL